MTINGISISRYGAKQHKVTYSYPERAASFEWPVGGASPIFHRNLPAFETVAIDLVFKGSSSDEIRTNIRRLLNLFGTPYVNISLDNGGCVMGTLQNARSQEISINKWHKLTLSLCGIVYRRIVGYGKTSRQLPVSASISASPIGGCQAIFTLASDVPTYANITISGLARDRKGVASDIVFGINLPGNRTDIAVYVGELPMGVSYFTARENPTLLSLADGTPINGEVGAVPRLVEGTNVIAVDASDITYDGAIITCQTEVAYLSLVDEE